MAAASASMLVTLKTLFIVLMLVFASTFVYSFVADGQSSCYDPSSWWMQAAETDYCVFVIFIMAWFFYKESSWIKRILFVCILFYFGSTITCGYIAMLFFKLSPEESLKDPVYFVLETRQDADANKGRANRCSHITAKVSVTAIGCYLLGLIIYAYNIHGYPFYAELYTPCMKTALVDLAIHTLVYSLWISYKESSWISSVFWIILLICFSGLGLCVYILKELFSLSSEEPLSQILFNKTNRATTSSDPLLTEQSEV